MRRVDREVTDPSVVREILQSCDSMRLGLVDEEGAYIVPLNFGFTETDGTIKIYFHSASVGKKIDILRREPKVSFQMDDGHELVTGELACSYSYQFRCLMGHGTVRLLSDPAAVREGLCHIMAHYVPAQDWAFPEKSLLRTVVGELTVCDWSCKVH